MSNEPESHSTSTSNAYKVQVKARSRPFLVGEKIIGTEWQSLPEMKSIYGFHDEPSNAMSGTHDYYAAVGLAAQFMNHFKWEGCARIIPYKLMVKHELRRDGEPLELADAIEQMLSQRNVPDAGAPHG